jgi:uncharacterized protein
VAKRKIELKKAIRLFVEEVRKKIPVEKVILFGSYAKGKPRTDSDIDLIVVSPAFARRRHIKNMQFLFHQAVKIDSRIEPIPATPDELNHLDERTFLAHAIHTGKVCDWIE